MKIKLELGPTVSPAERQQLRSILEDALPKLAAEELRKLRCEYRVGDRVEDCYGERLYISHIFDPNFGDVLASERQPLEYELRNHDDERCWKAATSDKFSFEKP